MRKVLRGICSVSALLLVVTGVALTSYAAWSVSSYTINEVTTPTFGLKIEEVYEPPEEGAFPGIDITKEVRVRNTGNTDALVRVKLLKQLGVIVNNKFKVDTSLDTSKLILDVNKKEWVYDEKEDWYYYRGILKENEITPPVLNSFKLGNLTGNQYKNLQGKIIVNAESVQYANSGLSIWGKTYDYLGLVKPKENTTDEITTVEFLDEYRKFNIELAKTDLFTNFKDITAGTIRSQRICVRNSYKDPIDIRLSIMTDKDLNPDSTGRLQAMLHEYCNIKIKDINGKEIYDGAIGGGDNSNIDLGVFQPREDKVMDISLSVREDMPSDYKDLAGYVRWVYEANQVTPVNATNVKVAEAKGEVTSRRLAKLVQTSECGLFYLGLALTLVGSVMLVMITIRRRRLNNEGYKGDT